MIVKENITVTKDITIDRVTGILDWHGNRFQCEVKKKKFSTVDDSGVLSQFHNPLTVKEEFLVPLGLELQDLYFYHYHALPPFFEHIMPEEFRKKSWEMENPVDWRGHFLASCFIVHCIKR